MGILGDESCEEIQPHDKPPRRIQPHELLPDEVMNEVKPLQPFRLREQVLHEQQLDEHHHEPQLDEHRHEPQLDEHRHEPQLDERHHEPQLEMEMAIEVEVYDDITMIS